MYSTVFHSIARFISLLILTNLKYEDNSALFHELKDWLQLQLQLQSKTSTEEQNNIIQIRDQLCAGFFLIYCKKFEESRNFLEQVEDLILPEYFEALKGELEKRQQQEVENGKIIEATSWMNVQISKYSKLLTNFLLYMKEFASALLEKMEIRHSLLVAAIRSNSKNFVLFCKKLIEILLKKMRIL